jgi:hypothetical protein
MKPLAYTASAVALWSALASGPTSAEMMIEGSPQYNARFNCARQFYAKQIQARDPRWVGHYRRLVAGKDPQNWGDRGSRTSTKGGRAVAREADRYCAARGQ